MDKYVMYGKLIPLICSIFFISGFKVVEGQEITEPNITININLDNLQYRPDEIIGGSASVKSDLDRPPKVSIQVFDPFGELVLTLPVEGENGFFRYSFTLDESYEAGSYTVVGLASLFGASARAETTFEFINPLITSNPTDTEPLPEPEPIPREGFQPEPGSEAPQGSQGEPEQLPAEGQGEPPTNDTEEIRNPDFVQPPSAESPSAPGGGSSTGGCLIATAAFGSELSPQVQFLRDFRDNRILSTTSGSSFMGVFNTWYYSFSPYVADYERQQPWLQQIIKTGIYPLLGVLQISEKAYSSIPGEFGAVAAGAIASSLIGAIYFWPLSILFVRKNIGRKREYGSTLNRKIIVSMIVIATVTIAAICSILFADSTILLMITTSLFVLTILITSAILSAKGMLRISGKVGSLLTRKNSI